MVGVHDRVPWWKDLHRHGARPGGPVPGPSGGEGGGVHPRESAGGAAPVRRLRKPIGSVPGGGGAEKNAPGRETGLGRGRVDRKHGDCRIVDRVDERVMEPHWSRRSRAAAVSALVLVSVLLSASGCGGRKDVRPEPSPAVLPTGPRVAVAPMENRSNDLSGSDILRDAFAEGVTRKGFAVVPVAESDRILRETLGISYGGQLPATTPEEVCKTLGV